VSPENNKTRGIPDLFRPIRDVGRQIAQKATQKEKMILKLSNFPWKRVFFALYI
jgi:hypothetical protein